MPIHVPQELPATPGRAPAPRRRTIGAILDNLDDGFQRSVWAELEAAGRAAGVNVVHFLTGNLNPDDPACRRRNAILDLIGPESVDGLVIPAMVGASHIGPARLDAYCRRFAPLPMVSLGDALPSMPSLVCEGRRGIRALVLHLAQVHGRRRFGFVAGTRENPHAALREQVFRATLDELGFPFDPRLRVDGKFLKHRTADEVRALVASGVPFDALVCATDEMAISTIDALEGAGVSVPEAVSVTGYDDIPEAARQSLPLTTVRQPTADLVRRGLELLLRILDGGTAAATEELATDVVVRRSCGCLPPAVVRAGAPVVAGQPQADVASVRDVLAAALGDVAGLPLEVATSFTLELGQALAAEVRGEAPPGTFAHRLDAGLRSARAAHLGDDTLEEILTALRREALARVSPAEAVEARLHQARILLKERAEQRQWRAHQALARRNQTLQYVTENLIGSFDVPTLLESMARELPRVGVRRCYLAVHASPERAYREARLLMAYDEGGRRDVGEGIVYPARQLVPAGMPGGDAPWNLVLQPLIFEEEEVGFLALTYDPRSDVSSLALSQQLRSALKASMMMQEIREKDRRLLEVDRLRNDFVANVTHDFRSLVAIIKSSSWLAQHPEGDAEGEDVAELRELLGTTYEASLRLKVAIDRLLDLASMDEHGLVVRIRPFRVRRFLAELAAFYRPVLAQSGIALEEHLPGEEVGDLYSDPDKVEQIMHNLVSNAARAVTPQGGRIRLSLTVGESAVELAVADDGEGIAPDRLEAIFVRFGSREKALRRGGTGIGLAFVRELSRYLRGAIRAESEGLGRGARFVLTLPRGKDVHPAVSAVVEERPAEQAEAAAARAQFGQLLASSLRGRRRPGP